MQMEAERQQELPYANKTLVGSACQMQNYLLGILVHFQLCSSLTIRFSILIHYPVQSFDRFDFSNFWNIVTGAKSSNRVWLIYSSLFIFCIWSISVCFGLSSTFTYIDLPPGLSVLGTFLFPPSIQKSQQKVKRNVCVVIYTLTPFICQLLVPQAWHRAGTAAAPWESCPTQGKHAWKWMLRPSVPCPASLGEQLCSAEGVWWDSAWNSCVWSG